MILGHLIVAATVGATPSKDERSTNPHFVEAEAAYRAERWDEAAGGFAAAFAEDPRPEYLYAQAQAERRAGRCPDAIETYDRFIATEPPPEAVADARANIEKCEAIVAAAKPVAPRHEPPTPTAEVQHPKSERDDGDALRPWYTDPWGGVLTWTGLAAVGTGAYLLGDAHRRQSRAQRASDEQGYRDALKHAPAMSRAGIGLLGVGGALLVAGIVRYATFGAAQRRARRARVDATLVPGRRPAVTFVVRW